MTGLFPQSTPALRAQATVLLSDLIRIDTTNPPGSETAAAAHLQRILTSEGIESELVAREPERANLVARIRGSGNGPSLALLGHLDVVPARPEEWNVKPFAGTVREGHIWGRGALDMKGQLAAHVLGLLLLARLGEPPPGDVVLVAEADEEDGSSGAGLPWLLEQRPDLRTDFALNEGGGERVALADGRIVYLLATAEKAAFAVRISATGTPGHAAVAPVAANALYRLVPALRRLETFAPRHRFGTETAALLDALVPGEHAPPERIERAGALHPFLAERLRALTGLTITPTLAAASESRNIVPHRAEVICDVRLLPGQTVAEALAEIEATLAGLEISVAPVGDPIGGTRSPAGTPLFDACATFVGAVEPGAVVLPTLCPLFTDSHFLREAFGTIAYGFFPYRHTDPSLFASMHGTDERVAVDDIVLGALLVEHVARNLGGSS